MEQHNQQPKHAWMRTGKDIMSLGLRQVPTLVYPFMPIKGAMSLAGSSDIGKSYFLLQLGAAVIQGHRTFLGFPLTVTHKSVIYVSTEDDDYSLCPRLLNLSKNNTDTDTFHNLRIITDTTDLLNRVEILLKEQPADVVIIDTFLDIYPDDMNQANKVRSFIQKYKELADRYSTLIIFNQHCGKKNDHRPPHKDNLLGSQGFESAMRTVLELRKDLTDPNKRHLCIVKGNYIGEEHKGASFVLDFSFDDGFSNTGERVEFSKLAKQEDNNQKRSTLRDTVAHYFDKGMTVSQIQLKVNEEGIKAGHTTVGNIVKELRTSIQKPIEDETDGQEDAA